jgi:hypothetical protein
MSIGKLVSLAVVGDGRISITWDDGHTALVVFAPIIKARAALAPLADPAQFDQAAISTDGWSIEWPCGIDFGSTQLRRWADEQAGDTMTAEAFRRWMERHGLTMDRAADALGLSRRTIAYYLSGEQPVTKTVLLATEGYDRRQAA